MQTKDHGARNAAALSQAESQRTTEREIERGGGGERRFASYDHSPHEAKLLALLKAVLSDKSLNKKKKSKTGAAASRGIAQGTKGHHGEKSFEVTF